MTPVGDVVGVSGALEILGVARPTLHRWEAAGAVHRVDPDGPPRYRRDHLEEVAASRAGDAERRRGTSGAVRRRILEQAADLIRHGGPDACTLEAVADRAGMSRGGVLHHFTGKGELLRALAAAFAEDFERQWHDELALLPPGTPAPLTRAYLAATAREPQGALAPAVLTALTGSSEIRDLLHRHVRGWYVRLVAEDTAEGLAGAGLRACLAADALWLLGLLHLPPLPPGSADGLLTTWT